jgi:predicted dithiol-disulfide oxidoreductase (DUF899 family)
MSARSNAMPPIVSMDEWLVARKRLLAKEKEATRMRDAINAERRRLPMVAIEKDYVFEGPKGKCTMLDLFEGRSQLFVHHFMWIDARDTGCPGCTLAADINFTPAMLAQFHERDVTFACISRVPYAKIAAYRAKRGWSFPWYSSAGSTFSYDMHASLDEGKAPIEFNYKSKAELLHAGFSADVLKGDWPVNSVFLSDGKRAYHTYSASARGLDQLATWFNFLDLTVYGRQEDWEDSPPGWPQRPTYG